MSVKYNRYTLKIYRSKLCNLNCGYCNIDYTNDDKSVSEEEIMTFIMKQENYYHISKDNIYLYGGEPSIIYSPDFIKKLLNHFKKITLVTNLYDEELITALVKVGGRRLRLSVSINNPETMRSRLIKFKNNIVVCTFVLTNDNVFDLYNAVRLVSDIDGNITITPELTNIHYKYEESILSNELGKIFSENLFWHIDNYHKIRHNSHYRDYNRCLDNNLIISNSGNLYHCEFVSDIYDYVNHDSRTPIGHIYSTLLADYTPEYVSAVHNSNDCVNECYARKLAIPIREHEVQFDKLFKYYIYNFKHKVNPDGIVLFLTEECNCNCSYCFEKTGSLNNNYMEYDTLIKWLTYAYTHGTPQHPLNVLLFGGEPTLHIAGLKNITKIMNLLRDKYNGVQNIGCVTFTINTNLLTINTELLQAIKELAECVKYLDISVSLDGCDLLQDLRCKNSYDKVLDNVRLLRKILNIGSPNRGNVGNAISISKSSTIRMIDYEYLIDCCINMVNETQELFDMATIKPVMNMDDEYEKEKSIGESMYHMKTLIADITNNVELHVSGNNTIREYLSILNGHVTISPSVDFTQCGILSKYISVRSNGKLIPCHSCIGLSNPNIVEIPDLINEDIIIDFEHDTYDFIDVEMSLKHGYINIVSEYTGTSCVECNHFARCMCFKDMKRRDKHTWMRSYDMCKRTLDQLDIFIEMQNREYEKELEEYERIESEKMQVISDGFNNLMSSQTKIVKIAELLTSED